MIDLDNLINEASASGGSERANYQLFIAGLCDVLGVPRPAMSQETNARNDYVFERSLDYRHPDGSTTKLYVDCYKRGAFVLEAKQSARRQAENSHQADMFGSEANSRRLGHARRGSPGWDRVMRAAYTQAVDYTRHLPVEHGYPPFVILVDVGHVIELYADFSGQGKNYAQFPDAQSFRISMEDLRDPEIQARLKAVWTDPHSLDPAKKSAEVTRVIAGRLSNIAKRLEGKHDPKDVAEFLMRCLFTMFAEDVGLLPDNIMVELLEKLVDNPAAFPPAMESLWQTMNTGGFEPHSMASLKHFNGGLFAQPKALSLAPEDIHELLVAARMDWRDVEPAIFGTLLERALDPRERSKLGAHFTPRAYVERLVVPTIIEPLRSDWEKALVLAEDLRERGDNLGALNAIRAFHRKLCSTRVLDPACGTGNFLYVSLELMKKLEGEVLDAISSLGGRPDRYKDFPEEIGASDVGRRLSRTGGTFTVDPHQFYGLELNQRAVPIADLVVWIGYLKWQLRTISSDEIAEPVLEKYDTIKHQDALLAYDARELVCDEQGDPVTRWDGVTTLVHPVTRQVVPDTEARIKIYKYRNPRPAEWPEVEFIVGNPPFVGNKRMIERLGEGEVTAIRAAYPEVPTSVDLVMYWWWKAATRLKAGPLRSFGFVTTNKITQSFNRRVVENAMLGEPAISLSFAVPDHPWNDEETSAAVRVAMTVAQVGHTTGLVHKIILENDERLTFATRIGMIRSRLSASVLDLAAARKLKANQLMAHQGVIPIGKGFRLVLNEAEKLDGGSALRDGIVRPYKIGRDLLQRDQSLYIIDLFGLDWPTALRNYPDVAAVVLERVKPKREQNRREKRSKQFWLYADSNEEMRNAFDGLGFYFGTCRTAKHRMFIQLEDKVLPDAKIVAIALADFSQMAVLSSRVHVEFANQRGGWQGAGNDPVYQHTDTFNAFAFPAVSQDRSTLLQLTELGVRLDQTRKDRLASFDFLSLTEMYNVLERIRELDWKNGPGRNSDSAATIEPLSDKERDIYDAGHIVVLKEIHDEIDTLVLSAYGWSDLAPRLVGRPGGTTPSPYKTEDQLAAEEELLIRLVALNQERAAEEARGLVRWLRPDYQIPKLGQKVARPDGVQQEADLVILPVSHKPKWPKSDTEQINVLVDLLRKAPAPVLPETLAATFDGRTTSKRRDRVASLLETLTTIGLARSGHVEGGERYFIPR